MKKRLIIIDANSLIHRAFHALPELTTAKGQMVNALYGFLLVFFKVIKEFKPDYIAACFDAPGPTKRGRQFAAYKAKRAKAPNELYDQIPLVKEALAAFGVPAFEQQGLEADDLIATIARIAPQKQAHPPLETIIVSGDMDTLQLVDDKTKVFTMRKGLQDTVLYDTAAVQKRFGGLLPEQLRDYKGLRGDPSDNIPGVTGIGDKTAIDLLSRFQSMENLYESEALKEIKPRTQALLVQYKDQALLSRDLATLDRNAPIDFSISNVSWSGLNTAKARELLERYEFRTLLGRVGENNSGNDAMSR
ncbi:MAG: DNA polymerase I, partial [Candidatus Wildermuthbacteria bacterium]|nr:DNA polymerase I [Candidatus Wildermuthbacteria bacterium]